MDCYLGRLKIHWYLSNINRSYRYLNDGFVNTCYSDLPHMYTILKNYFGNPLIGSKTLPLLFGNPHPVVFGWAVYLLFVLFSVLLVFFHIIKEQTKN